MKDGKKGKLTLSGFDLEPTERESTDKVLNTYLPKIENNVGYKSIKLQMKKSKKLKTFLHEIKGTLITPQKSMKKTRFEAEAVDYNPYKALSEVLNKLLNEAKNSKRTKRQ